jgi:hypothetical protein
MWPPLVASRTSERRPSSSSITDEGIDIHDEALIARADARDPRPLKHPVELAHMPERERPHARPLSDPYRSASLAWYECRHVGGCPRGRTPEAPRGVDGANAVHTHDMGGRKGCDRTA